MGDLNADQLSDSADARFLRYLLSDNSLTSVPFGAIYHTSTSDSALDLCVVDLNDIVIVYWKTDIPFADGHDLISASILSSITPSAPRDFTFRDFKSSDTFSICDDLKCDWFVFKLDYFLRPV